MTENRDERQALLLQQLLAFPIAQRIEAVADDVLKRQDKFREIEPHDLADALEVPQPWSPSGEWGFTRYAEKTSIEAYAEINSVSEVFGLLHTIEDKIPITRLRALHQHYSDFGDNAQLDLLTAEERSLFEDAIAREELESAADGGMNCLAHYSVEMASGYSLRFEGDIEDDGTCIDLRTPYDFRDGKFVDLDNCLTDHW